MSIERDLDAQIKSLPIITENFTFLKNLVEYLSTKIEVENPAILRAQISEAYLYMGSLARLKSRAEALYRVSQKKAAESTSKEFKAHAREGVINGETANYRFSRDLLEGYLDTLNSKLSASKAILLSLDAELKRMPSID